MSRDNWERLVTAVVRRQQLWEICHAHSRSPSISTVSSDLSFEESEFSFSLGTICVSSPRPVPPANPSVSQVGKNATGAITRKLFSAPATARAWFRRRKEAKHDVLDYIAEEEVRMGQLRRFSLRELEVATDSFSGKNVLDRRTCVVCKGQLADGSFVAVKRLKVGNQRPFDNELKMIRLRAVHPNLLRLLGFCITERRVLLVYPFMVNGSIASCLRGGRELKRPLDWTTRKRIALGSARGLAYLHDKCELKIIHRNVKAANIYLDEYFEAVLGDFELVKFVDQKDTSTQTAVGTIGNIAPEYVSTDRCSKKTDVFAYGMFLLELITGQKPLHLAGLANGDDMMLLDWVKKMCSEKKDWKKLVDANCHGNHMEEVVGPLIQLALLCTYNSPEDRPKMSEIIRMLKRGDGLAEKWEEWYRKQMFPQEFNHITSPFSMSPEQLDGPRCCNPNN